MKSPSQITARDAVFAVSIAGAFAALYCVTVQGRVFGNDGAFLCEWAASSEHSYGAYHNVLFHRAAHWLTQVWSTADPLTPVRTLGAVAGGIGLGACFVCGRGLGLSRAASTFGSLLAGFTPAHWFFATTVEVHAMHFAIVSLCACAIVLAPWHRPWLALGVSCAVLPLTYLSHQSAPALGFGWLLLAQCGRLRHGAGFGFRALLGIGIALLGALLLGQMTGNAIRGHDFALEFGALVDTVTFWQRTAPGAVLLYELVLPLGLLLPTAIAGWMLDRGSPWRTLATLALFTPTAGFIVYWGIIENGGYMLGPSIALAIAAGFAWQRLTATTFGARLLLALLPLQAIAGLATVLVHDHAGFQITDRVEHIRGLLDGPGYVVSATPLAPSANIHLPEVQELSLLPSLVGVTSREDWIANHMPPAALLALVGQRPFVLDRSYVHLEEHWRGLFRDCLEALEAEIRAKFDVIEHPDASWDMWLVVPR